MDRPKPLRLFVAADVPDGHLDAIEIATEELRDRLPNARWTSRTNRHVTLKFLGSTDPDLIDDVQGAVGAAAGAETASELELTELGAFPSIKRARVLWVGLADPSETLGRLARRLDENLAPLGFEAEKRAFTAHLTLARLKAPAPIDPLPAVDLTGLGPFALDRVVLWRSHLSPKGATYERLGEYPLRGSS
jgi:2'-5' RNA ligase